MTDFWIERAQSAEAKVKTLEDRLERILEPIKNFKTAFGVREKQSGVIDVDYEKFATNLGFDGCTELRKVMEEVHKIPNHIPEEEYFTRLVEYLGPEKCLLLRKLIDKTHKISGKSGQKPRLKVAQ